MVIALKSGGNSQFYGKIANACSMLSLDMHFNASVTVCLINLMGWN
jgi:hypothetical protein